jgi:hypothetical protein
VPATLGNEAAALLLQGMTAHYLACDTHPLKPGDTAVVRTQRRPCRPSSSGQKDEWTTLRWFV